MSVVNKTTLINYFRAGDIPSQDDYRDLINSCFLIPVEGGGVIISVSPDGNNRLIRINDTFIVEKIRELIGDDVGGANDPTITIRMELSNDESNNRPFVKPNAPLISSFSLNQSNEQTINLKLPNGVIKIIDKGGKASEITINKIDDQTNNISLASVAFSGEWEDINNKPDIPDPNQFLQVQTDWDNVDPNSPAYLVNRPDFGAGQLFIMQNGRELTPKILVITENEDGETVINFEDTEQFSPKTTQPTYYQIEATDWEAYEGAPNELKNKPLFSKVAYSGNFNDLLYKPGVANNTPIKIYRNKIKNHDAHFVGSGGGFGATAIGTLKVSVVEIDVIEGGVGYNNIYPPIVTISDPETDGIVAEATSIVNNTGSVSRIKVENIELNKGYSFANPPTVTIAAPTGGGRSARAVAILDACLDTIEVGSVGEHYTSEPMVTIVGGDGSAAAYSTINEDGELDSIIITNPGRGFTDDKVEILIGGVPIIFTLNQPNPGEYDLGLGLVAFTNLYHDLDEVPYGNLFIYLNGMEIPSEMNLPPDSEEWEPRFQASSKDNHHVNINAVTEITMEGDVLSETIPVDENGHLLLENRLRPFDTEQTTIESEYAFSDDTPTFQLVFVDKTETDGKGRVGEVRTTTYTIDFTNAKDRIVKLEGMDISLVGDVLAPKTKLDEHGNFIVDTTLKEFTTQQPTSTQTHTYDEGTPTITLKMVEETKGDGYGRVEEVKTVTHTIDFTPLQETIEEHNGRITTLEAIGGKWIGSNFETVAALRVFDFSTYKRINEGDYTYVIADEDHLDDYNELPQRTLYRWVGGSNTGTFVFSHVVQEDPLGSFTNEAFGVIKGETTKPFYVNAQPNGTGKVNRLPKVLDYDNDTNKVWLDIELPDGYCVFGFNKGYVSNPMNLTLVSYDDFSHEYLETDTSVLENTTWKKFYVYPCDLVPGKQPDEFTFVVNNGVLVETVAETTQSLDINVLSQSGGVNIPFTVNTSALPNWITPSGNLLNIAANTTQSVREGKILYTQSESGLVRELTVFQIGQEMEIPPFETIGRFGLAGIPLENILSFGEINGKIYTFTANVDPPSGGSRQHTIGMYDPISNSYTRIFRQFSRPIGDARRINTFFYKDKMYFIAMNDSTNMATVDLSDPTPNANTPIVNVSTSATFGAGTQNAILISDDRMFLRTTASGNNRIRMASINGGTVLFSRVMGVQNVLNVNMVAHNNKLYSFSSTHIEIIDIPGGFYASETAATAAPPYTSVAHNIPNTRFVRLFIYQDKLYIQTTFSSFSHIRLDVMDLNTNTISNIGGTSGVSADIFGMGVNISGVGHDNILYFIGGEGWKTTTPVGVIPNFAKMTTLSGVNTLNHYSSADSLNLKGNLKFTSMEASSAGLGNFSGNNVLIHNGRIYWVGHTGIGTFTLGV